MTRSDAPAPAGVAASRPAVAALRRFVRVRWVQLCLLGLITLHLTLNAVWLSLDTEVQGVDVENHLLFQQELTRALGRACGPHRSLAQCLGGGYDAIFRPVQHSAVYWPPGVYLVTLLFKGVLGDTLFATRMGQQPFLILLLLSTFWLGRRLWNERCGVLAAALVSVIPMVYQSSREYALDLPLAAAVTWCCVVLLRSQGLRSTGWSLVLGLSLGLGALVKGQIIIFLAPMVLLQLLVDARGRWRRPTRWVMANLVLCGLLASSVALHWYLPAAREVMDNLGLHLASSAKAAEGHTGAAGRFEPQVFAFHTVELFRYTVGPLLSLVLLFGAGRALIDPQRRRLLFPLVLFLWSLAAFSLVFMVKHGRFLLPALPALAILAAAGLLALRRNLVRRLALAATAVIAVVQLVLVSFVLPCHPTDCPHHWGKLQLAIGGARYVMAPVRRQPCAVRLAQMVSRRPHTDGALVGLLERPGTGTAYRAPYEVLRQVPGARPVSLLLERAANTGLFIQQLPAMDFLAVQWTGERCPVPLSGMTREQLQGTADTSRPWQHLLDQPDGQRTLDHIVRHLRRPERAYRLLGHTACRERVTWCLYRQLAPSKQLSPRPIELGTLSRYWVPLAHGKPDRLQAPVRRASPPRLRFSCNQATCEHYLNQRAQPDAPVNAARALRWASSPIWIPTRGSTALLLEARTSGGPGEFVAHLRGFHRGFPPQQAVFNAGQLRLRLRFPLTPAVRHIGLVLRTHGKHPLELRSLRLRLEPPG